MRGIAAGLAFALLACGGGVEGVRECIDVDGVRVVCGLQNPEDLALLSDGKTVIATEYGGMEGGRRGHVAAIDVETGRVWRLFPREASAEPEAGWGDPDCTDPPTVAFSPHGLDLATLPNGRERLLVVNHGGREAVEVFEVQTLPSVSLVWRGCARPPESAVMNDVVSLPDGGFLVTHMFDQGSQFVLLARVLLGADTGRVLEWQPEHGFEPIEGTEGSMPNGIEVSEDGDWIYVNFYAEGSVARISRETGETLSVADVRQPDNSTWTEGGRLLVASHPGTILDVTACDSIRQGACPLAYEIVALSPDLSVREVVYANEGPPMGAGTVALHVGDEIWIGSFAGDRIARVPIP